MTDFNSHRCGDLPDEDEDEEFGCLYPDKCLMHSYHFTFECYTAEDVRNCIPICQCGGDMGQVINDVWECEKCGLQKEL